MRDPRGPVCFLAVAFLVVAAGAAADQYQSEARVLQGPVGPSTPQDEQKQLQTTTDPYAKAMLLRDLAGAAASKKDYDTAAKYLDQALALHALSGPAEQQMRSDLSALHLGGGGGGSDPKSVIARLGPQFRANANLPVEQLIALGAAYLKEKQFREAVGPLQKGVAASKNPDLSWRRGLYAAYIGNDQEKEAAQVLETAVRDQPSSRDDWTRLSALYLKLGNRERAQAVIEVASRLGYLDTPDQRLQLISLTAQIGAPFQAGSQLHDWMQSGKLPSDPQTLRLQAALWIQARESTLAIPALEAVLKVAPSADLWLQLGQLRLDREDYREAAQALEQGIGNGGKSGPSLMALGVAKYQQADVDGAISAFRLAEAYPANSRLAAQWVTYLGSGAAREQAIAAAANRRTHDDTAPTLAGGVPGEVAHLADTATESAPEAPPAASAAVASGSGGLTPVGAEQSGTADGAVPAWTGGITRSQRPAGYAPGGRYVDLYAAEKPLFTITAANLAQYGSHLSDGHKALFRKYPDYTMPVYASHRTVAYPQAIYDASKANEGKAKLVGADSIADARLGVPFVRPDSGVEIMWNHRLRYRGDSQEGQSTQAIVGEKGIQETLKQTEHVYYRYGNVRDPVNIAEKDILLYYLTWFSKGSNGVDFVVLVHETANSLKDPRGIWVIPPNIPKMFRIPPVGYDQPFPASDGLYFLDMVDMYNGLFDAYVWKLTGKRELYIPYNAWRISDGHARYAQLLQPHHFNQSAARYEMHRVWVIEATLREGHHHSFGKRLFYIDEDSWNVVLVENYDQQGGLWRFQEGHLLPEYDVQAANCAPVLSYDLKDGRYFANRMLGEDPPTKFNTGDLHDGDFVPDAVRARYTR